MFPRRLLPSLLGLLLRLFGPLAFPLGPLLRLFGPLAFPLGLLLRLFGPLAFLFRLFPLPQRRFLRPRHQRPLRLKVPQPPVLHPQI